MLKVGDFIPLHVAVLDSEEKEIELSQYLGKYLVIYFYPKDETPGCTIEACELRDHNKEIEELGAKVIGISKDSTISHERFTKKHMLNFTLLSDVSTELMKAFGNITEKKFMGKTFMGTERSTFVVDPQGKILHVWEKVNPLGHAGKVLEFLKEIIKPE